MCVVHPNIPAGMCRMRGTDHAPARCAALIGTVGVAARCGIYEWRPELHLGITKLKNKLLKKTPQETQTIKPITSTATLR